MDPITGPPSPSPPPITPAAVSEEGPQPALRGKVNKGFGSAVALGIAKMAAMIFGRVPVFAASAELKRLEAKLELKKPIGKGSHTEKIAFIRDLPWDEEFKDVSKLSTAEQIRFVRKAYALLHGGNPYTYGGNVDTKDGVVFRYKKPVFYRIYEHISTEARKGAFSENERISIAMHMDPSIWNKDVWDAYDLDLPSSTDDPQFQALPDGQKTKIKTEKQILFIHAAYESLWKKAAASEKERRSLEYRAARFYQSYMQISAEARKGAFTDEERKKIDSEILPAFLNMRKEDLVFDRKPSKDNVLTRDKMEFLSLRQKHDHFTFYVDQAKEDASYARDRLTTLAKSLTDSERMYFAKAAAERLQSAAGVEDNGAEVTALKEFFQNLELTEDEKKSIQKKYKGLIGEQL